jgi:capsular polysaccharide transport system permease protein
VLASRAEWRPNFFTALRIQWRVIGALILRESRTRFGKNRLGYFWAVVEPVIHVAVWVYVINFISTAMHSNRMLTIGFNLTGFIPFLAVRHIADFMERSIAANHALLYYPIVRPADFIIARWLLEAATQTIVAVLLFSGAILLGFMKTPASVTVMALAMATGFAFGLGWGWCNAVFSELSLTYKRTEAILSRILYFISGVMYSIEMFPPAYKYWLSLNPLAHILELVRIGYYPGHQSSFASTSYVLVFGFVLLIIGVVGMRLAGTRLYEP